MTRRRWIATEFDDFSATLSGAQAEHLARVLRAEPGMRADVVAGERVYHAVIETVTGSAVRFHLEQEIEAGATLPIGLLLAVFKFDRMEWAIEKATELGVSKIVPLIARRTEKHLAQAATRRVERWRRIAMEATKQSRGSSVPDITAPLQLSNALKESVPQDGARILLSEYEKQYTLAACLTELHLQQHDRITLAIGPEGGWTDEEAAQFVGAGWSSATLGTRILRAETAVIASLSIASALLAEPLTQ